MSDDEVTTPQRPPMMRTFKSFRNRVVWIPVAVILVPLSNELAQSPKGINEIELHVTKVVLIIMITFLLGCLIRAPWTATLQVRATSVVYRSMFRTRQFPLAEILRVETKPRWLRSDWEVPVLVLRDGRRVQLGELSIPIASRSESNHDLVTTINDRISGHIEKSY